jgi:hypothetical protein
METYPPGSARRNTATGAVAVRTELPAPRQWLVVDLVNGGSYADAATIDTAEWVDLVEVSTP